LTATVVSYFVGQDLDTEKLQRDMLREELEAARAERQSLAVKLNALQSHLAELLNRT
jgi:hypothetical protein